MVDFLTAKDMVNAFVPIRRFNKGEAGKIIEEVKHDGIRIIVKNNAPECVLLSVESFSQLVDMSQKK